MNKNCLIGRNRNVTLGEINVSALYIYVLAFVLDIQHTKLHIYVNIYISWGEGNTQANKSANNGIENWRRIW